MSQELLTLPTDLSFATVPDVYHRLSKMIKAKKPPNRIILDFSNVSNIDSAGAALVQKVRLLCGRFNIELSTENISKEVRSTLELFEVTTETELPKKPQQNFFENIGDRVYAIYLQIVSVFFLVANVFYWGVAALFRYRLRRRGEVIHQSVLIGVNALPIIALISFLIGFILALQSAAQLRQFGANIYVADLVAIAMVSEMGPLITAIMVAGRSGSAIAAEIATMVVTEEIDALKVMGIDPIPYLIVPKLFAITMTVPLLTMFANVIGIIGGLVIGVSYLDLEIIPFYNEVITVLRYKEVMTAIVKSFCFALVIILTGAHFGLRVKGGAEGVGRATTAAVVVSIFLVIVVDSILGIIFYFGEPAF